MKTSLMASKSAEFYRNFEPIPDPNDIAAAKARLEASQSYLAAAIADYAAGILTVEYTSAVPTLAVTLLPDGFAAQLVNPDFANALVHDRDLAFVRTHEMYHLILRHLFGAPEERNETQTLAQEAIINDRVQALFSPNIPPRDRPMPQHKGPDGKVSETGVNPYELWERYRADLKGQGLTPVSYVDFTSSDLRCYAELLKMKKSPKPRGYQECTTGASLNSPSSGDGSGSGQSPHIDSGTLKDIANESLGNVVRKVMQNPGDSGGARDEILGLMEATGDSETASKIWGDLGAGALRGETSATRRTEYWKQFISEQLSSRLVEGSRLVYNQAIWWSPRLGRKGDEDQRHVLIAVDTSGSMQPAVLEHIATLLGEEDGLTFEFLAFDAVVYPFSLGDEFRGGGGTRFDIIDEYVQNEAESSYDAILVVTDGYAPAFTPAEPDKWVWLITPGGSTWPEDHSSPMSTFEIDIVDV